MPADPIINLGVPIVQAYLAGISSRQRQQGLELDARNALFARQQADVQNQQWQQDYDRLMANQQYNQQRNAALDAQNRQYQEAQIGNMNTDNARAQSEFDLRQQQYQRGLAQEQAAQRGYTAMAMPELSRGLATGQSADPFADMERIQAFSQAPSQVQGPFAEALFRAGVEESTKARLLQQENERIDRLIEAVGRDTRMGPDMKASTIAALQAKKAGVSLPASVLQPQMSPEQMQGYAGDLQTVYPNATPERAAAAVRLREGGFPVGLGDANLSGQTRTSIDPYLVKAAQLRVSMAEDVVQEILKRKQGFPPTEGQPDFEIYQQAVAELNAARQRFLQIVDPQGRTGPVQQGPDAIDQVIGQLTPEQIMQIIGGRP